MVSSFWWKMPAARPIRNRIGEGYLMGGEEA